MYVRKLPSGKWQATVRHPNGRKLTKSDPVKRVVIAWAQEMETAFRVGNAPSERGRRMTLGEWSGRWLAARNVEATTAAKDISQLRTHVLPKWEAWPLGSIGRLDVQAWVKDMGRAGVGPNTVGAAYRLLSGMLADAVLEGLIGASPCRQIDLPKVVKPEARWLTRDEYDRLMDALSLASRPETWRAYVAAGCFTGMRPGELAGLDVRSVDFDRRLAYVSQVVTRAGLRAYGKSSHATRWVPFPDEVANLLWPLCADRAPDAPVFTSPTGERVNEANFRNRIWRPALALAGIEPLRVYVMRHTAASWLIQAGVPDSDIAQILGHSSTRIVGTYAHLNPTRHDRVRAAWSESSWRTSGAQTPPTYSQVEENRR